MLKAKQERFCQEYLIDLNATQAAIRAKYSEKTARSQAATLLTKSNIQARLAELNKEREAATGVTQEYVISSLKSVADRCMQKEAVLDHNGKETGQYRFDSSGANRALELLAKHLGLFAEDNKQRAEGFAALLKLIPED